MELNLTSYERDMLDGKHGRFKQVAMEKICRYAKVLGATELCTVTMATLYCGAHNYLEVLGSDDAHETFSVMNMGAGRDLPLGRFSSICQCQSCVEPFDDLRCRELEISNELKEKNERYMQYFLDAGVMRVTTCAPYLTGWVPVRGQHFVTSESSNVLLCNSLFGACGNPDGIEAGFWAAACGRIPKWGKHVPANRLGTCLVKINIPIESAFDWDLLGYTIGKIVPSGSVPVLEGEFILPNILKFKQLAASLAVVSDVDMCHIVGLTPEAATTEMAFGGKEPQAVYQIDADDLERCRRMLCNDTPGKVKYISLGCPHYSLAEIKDVVDYLGKRKFAKGIVFQIWTAYSIRKLADRCGYTKIIQEAGGDIYAGHCPFGVFEHEESKKKILADAEGVAVDAAKIAQGLPAYYDAGIKTYYGTKYQCIDAAVNGYWEGK
ncbi:MAG: aconitase X [Bacillota bacterium]|jgi:predicted aconitase